MFETGNIMWLGNKSLRFQYSAAIDWKASLKWQRLKPFEKFAEMVERHWEGIAAHCKPENKVSLG